MNPSESRDRPLAPGADRPVGTKEEVDEPTDPILRVGTGGSCAFRAETPDRIMM